MEEIAPDSRSFRSDTVTAEKKVAMTFYFLRRAFRTLSTISKMELWAKMVSLLKNDFDWRRMNYSR